MARSIDELPSNIVIVTPEGKPTYAMVFYLQSMQVVTEQSVEGLDALQKELDDTQTGAGLNSGGNYVPSTTSNYIDTATSLFIADLLLDNAIFDNVRELIVSATIDTQLSEASQAVLVDATSGALNITLPNPVNCFSNNRSYKIGITKIDITSNVVNILPFATELVVGEASQQLLTDGEVLNFITDGTNWYLRS